MTKKPKKPQQCWYIKVPVSQFPKPQHHPGQQVGILGQDNPGTGYYDIGMLIGMEYTGSYNEPKGWFYRIRFLKCDYNPSLVGLEDEEFITEALLVADNTVLETVE